VDPTRVVVHGHETGGSLAFVAAFRNQDMIRAVAAVEPRPRANRPENDPLNRLAVYVAAARQSPIAQPLEQAVAALGKMKIPSR